MLNTSTYKKIIIIFFYWYKIGKSITKRIEINSKKWRRKYYKSIPKDKLLGIINNNNNNNNNNKEHKK